MISKHLLFLFALALTLPFSLDAQEVEKQMLSVTPPLLQNSIQPGTVWQSALKVVNGNQYPLTIYAEVVNFEPVGEAGRGRFVPREEGSTGHRLADWVVINTPSITIAPEQTSEVSFFVDMPKDAAPGGHYAAILISTEPPTVEGESFAVRASQVVASLLFFRVEGDIDENGLIREFRVLDSFVPTPEASFQLRFENKGNVHVQPRGEITIRNMWGTDRGKIPVNYKTHFGNVLPKSIRDFSFTWKSEFSFTDIGRYSAEVVLSYGESGSKTVASVTHFWVLPVKVTLITVSVIATIIYLITLMVRAYVRRMLALAGVDTTEVTSSYKVPEKRIKSTYRNVAAPLRAGVLDLRTQLRNSPSRPDHFKAIVSFVLKYKYFFISIILLSVMFVGFVYYLDSATRDNAGYTVTVDEE